MTNSIEKFYDEWHKSAESNRTLEIRDRDLLAIEYVGNCRSLLELGCGCGVLLNRASSAQKAGADISAEAIKIAKKEVHASGKVDLRVVNIDSENLPWESNSFEGCMAVEVLEHLFDPVHALAELNRVLEKNGKIVVTIPNSGYFYYRYYHLVTGGVSDFHGNGMIVDEHIRYYCERQIMKMMQLTGFGHIRIKGVMKTVVSTETIQQKRDRKLSFRKLLHAVRPTPVNVLSKSNKIFHLWKRYPSLFAVGLVIEARKVEESKFRYNAAIDHQHRTAELEKLNINYVD
ncbi:methyltransferase type 11 [Candidatus Scalindua japonica]|uniref:Methyltransferase type 11 n=1 Tax=Candidatus Scalindua japonica TaxID=1284222 RepID=A0A286U444_9BACT|nr:class I SAM-dependent methyltransferase [Candidatus Scalindua japonica]GAX62918.1 methyltransferase type 11 [Candidatus Scalindua japonica]